MKKNTKPLTKRQLKLVLTTYVITNNMTETAKKHKLTHGYISKLVKKQENIELIEQLRKELNTKDYDECKDKIKTFKNRSVKFLDYAFDYINKPEVIEGATLREVTTAMGIIIDKIGIDMQEDDNITIVNDLPNES